MLEVRRAAAAFLTILFVMGGVTAVSAETVTTPDGTVIEKFGNWRGKCQDAQAAGTICSVSFEIRSEQNQTIALLFGIGKNPNNEYYAVTVVPLGTNLPNGVKFTVDGSELAAIPLQFCVPVGCQSVSPVGLESLQKLKAGNTLVVEFVDVRRGPVSLDVSLSGMTAAINWLDAQSRS